MGSLGPGAHKVLFEPSFQASLVGMGLAINTVSFLLPSCWGFSFAFVCGVSFFFFFGASHILLSMVVQQQVAILEFSQWKMSSGPTLPSSS